MADTYRIQIIPTEECNPEYAPEKDEQEGIPCDGFLLVTFRDGKPYYVSMKAVSTEVIKNFIRWRKNEAANVIRAAAIMADAEIRGLEIIEQTNTVKEAKVLRSLQELFKTAN